MICTASCQGNVADLMREEATKHPGQYRFVVNAGDVTMHRAGFEPAIPVYA